MFATTVYARYAQKNCICAAREKQKLQALQAQVFPQQGQKRKEEKKNTINDYVALKNRFGDLNVTYNNHDDATI
jgi:hypothetical protein